MRSFLSGFLAAAVIALPALSAKAADLAVLPPAPAAVVYAPAPVLPAPRRYLTTYMAHYPFGVLREDYTPLGAPGLSKRAYYGVPRLYATLHVPVRRWARKVLHRRVVVTARY